MFTHTYQICGTKFQSQSNRAKYCVYCRDKSQVLRNKEYKEKKAAGTSIAVGSEQICPICNQPYTVTSGSQKCCKGCQKKQESKRKVTANAKHMQENYDFISFYVPKGQRDKLKAYAKSQNLSVNIAFFSKCSTIYLACRFSEAAFQPPMISPIYFGFFTFAKVKSEPVALAFISFYLSALGFLNAKIFL